MTHKLDTLLWVKKVIDSCTNYSQWAKCITLIQRYEISIRKDDDYLLLSRNLRGYHDAKLRTFKK